MKEKHIQIIGIAFTAIYALFVVFLYAAEPKSLEDISLKARSTMESAATKGQIITGTYEVDAAKFAEGLRAFNADNFVAARDAFERADPEKRDAKTQFYIAYTFYRQGWGRLSNDDELFKQGIAAVDRVTPLDRDFRSDDPGLKMHTPAELRYELEEGTRITADDFNPLRLIRERK
ncbi:MAG: hypothetical protein ACR2IH_06635 [Pyrinomonadaceae bacterium]